MNRAAARLQEFRQQVEAGGLAGAVRPDQCVDVAAPHAQIHIAHRNETGKFFCQRAGFENVLTQSSPPRDTSSGVGPYRVSAAAVARLDRGSYCRRSALSGADYDQLYPFCKTES